MKNFSREEIEKVKRYFESQNFPRVRSIIGGRSFEYFVLPAALNSELSNFVMRMTSNLSSERIYGVSEDIMLVSQPYCVFHEVYEFESRKKCSESLEEELKIIPVTIKREHVEMRRKFFESLIRYVTKNPEGYSKEDVEEFRRSMVRLENELRHQGQ